jgi:hypothetical protein
MPGRKAVSGRTCAGPQCLHAISTGFLHVKWARVVSRDGRSSGRNGNIRLELSLYEDEDNNSSFLRIAVFLPRQLPHVPSQIVSEWDLELVDYKLMAVKGLTLGRFNPEYTGTETVMQADVTLVRN